MTEQQSANASIDHLVSAACPIRGRVSGLCSVLLILSLLVGAVAWADSSTNYPDLAKIVAVLAFIGSMLALALGMVGDSCRP